MIELLISAIPPSVNKAYANNKGQVSVQQCIEAYEKTLSVHKAGARLGVSGDTVHKRLKQSGYKLRGQKFSSQEDALIAETYSGAEIIDLVGLAKKLGRPKTNVCRRARELGCATRYGRPVTEKRKKAHSKHMKAWLCENDHPRGALGMAHSEETKAVLSKISLASHKKMRREGRGPHSESNKQASSDRMTKWRATMSASQIYSRAKRGVRDDIGAMYFRSSWEANYARYLNWLQERGDIDRWEYEPETFWFEKIKRGVRSYTPDFKIFEKEQSYFVEVKGWLDPKSKTKLKRMAKYHPGIKLILFGQKDYESLRSNLGKVIPNWE